MSLFTIVIPSYARSITFKNKTLALLQYHNIPKDNIYLFLASDDEKVIYESVIGTDACNVVIGVIGLAEQRNVIYNYFPKGTALVCMDDDVEAFYKLENSKLRAMEQNEFSEIINLGFKECIKSGACLWSVYPCKNAFFMKDTITYDFKFCIGSFWGCFNPGDEIRTTQTEKEDYIRCIHFWKRNKAIVRLNNICFKTTTYGGTGGLQSVSRENRIAREIIAVADLILTYPEYIRLNKRRKSPFPEILLRRLRNDSSPKI